MGNLLYIVAVVLIILWAIGFHNVGNEGGDYDGLSGVQKIRLSIDHNFSFAINDLNERIKGSSLFCETFPRLNGHHTHRPG